MANFFLSKSVSGYFKTKKIKTEKKVPMTTKPMGGGEALVVGPLKKEFFLRLPLVYDCSA